MWKLWKWFVGAGLIAEIVTHFNSVPIDHGWILYAGGWAALMVSYRLGQQSARPTDNGPPSDPRFHN